MGEGLQCKPNHDPILAGLSHAWRLLETGLVKASFVTISHFNLLCYFCEVLTNSDYLVDTEKIICVFN